MSTYDVEAKLDALIKELRALREETRPVSIAFDGDDGPMFVLFSDGSIRAKTGGKWRKTDTVELEVES